MENKQWVLNGELFRPKIIERKVEPTFKESHTRITTYIDNNLHIIIKILLEHNQIDSISGFINESIRYYLMKEKNDFSSNNY